jgi:hypothetical protein
MRVNGEKLMATEFDVRQLGAAGGCTPGACGVLGGPHSIHVKATDGQLALIYMDAWKDCRQRIRVIQTANAKATVWLAECPLCDERCATLTLVPGKGFACVKCARKGLDGRSAKNVPEFERLQARALKLRRALGDFTSPPDKILKPRRMPRARWRSYVERLQALELAGLRAFEMEVEKALCQVN